MPSIQTRFVEDLRDIYKDKEIWIIGTGKSLDDFPITFFDDKIYITLNWSIIPFPNCTYWHGHHELYRDYLRERLELLEKSILLYPFPGPFAPGTRTTDPVAYFGDLTSVPIWMKFHDIRPIPKIAFEETVKGIIEKKDVVRYHASMSVAHTGIEVAAILGAKKITLAGCEHKAFDNGKGRPIKHEFPKRYPNYSRDLRIIDGTCWLAELFGEHGIEIERYYNADTEYYKQGYEIIKTKK